MESVNLVHSSLDLNAHMECFVRNVKELCWEHLLLVEKSSVRKTAKSSWLSSASFLQ